MEQNNNITKEKDNLEKVKVEIIKNETKIMIATITEVFLIIVITNSIITISEECMGFDCLDKILPELSLYLTIPAAIINIFVIQYLRKKT